MPSFVYGLLLMHLPTIVICGAFYSASRSLTHTGMAKFMRRSAVFWFSVLMVVYTVTVLASETCNGNMLYGYSECWLVPTTLANQTFFGALMSTTCAIIYAAVLIVITIIVEWRHRA